MDPALIQQPDGSFDVAMNGPDLVPGNPLLNDIILSLFSDAPALPDDVLPSGASSDRRGWFGDAYADVPGDVWGSRLWLLERAKCDQDTLNRGLEYAQEALQHLIDDGVAASIDITTFYPCTGRMTIEGVVNKPDGSNQPFSYDYVWKDIQDAVS